MNKELPQQLNEKDKNLISFLQETIQIPSWVSEKDNSKNENRLVDYMEKWMKENTDMEVERQTLEGNRFNLICKRGNPDTIFLAHTDTVSPSNGAPYNQFAAEINDGKIWGLGSTDMKSGMCAVAQALAMVPEAKNVWYMMYADEEYDFLGMKGLVEKYGDIKPKLIISADGSDLKIGHGCRGLIDFQARIEGQTGHAAKGNGLNAIDGTFEIRQELSKYVENYKHPIMGNTSTNLGYLIGGKKMMGNESLSPDGTLFSVGKANNIIADIAEFGIDIRPSSPDLDYKNVVTFLSEIATKKGYQFEMVKKNHDLGAWYSEREDLTRFENIAQQICGENTETYDNPGKTGYIDLQMLWDVTGRPLSFMFGGGNGDVAHKANEHIEISSLLKMRDFFVKVLKDINSK